MRPLTALEKWSYAIGNMPFAVKDAAFINFVVFYYTQVQGLSGSLTGLAMFIAISWDALNDPLIGSWSDSFKSRWGRRHPLLLAGGLPTAALFLALFAPPQGLGDIGVFLWLTIISMLLRTVLTVYYIPYSAMGAELSNDYDERTVIAKARVSMAWLAGMCLPAFAFLVIFRTQGDVDGRLVAANYEAYGIISAVLAGISIIFCVWGTRTLINRLPAAVAGGRISLWRQTVKDFRAAFSNRNFRIVTGSNLSFGMAAGVYSTLALYLGTYFWEFSSEQLAGLIIPTALGTLLAFAMLGRLGRRYDKVTLLCASCLGIAFTGIWFAGARLADWLPPNGHPLIYTLQWLNTLMAVFFIVGLQIVAVSLIADMLDEQELNTGLRQEGVFFAVGTFITKATTGVGALLAGIVIDVAGITPGTAPGDIAPRSLELLGSFYIAIVFVLSIIAFLFNRNIRLSRADHQRLQAALNARAAVSEQ